MPLRGDRYAGDGLLPWRLDQRGVYVGRREAAATGSICEIDDEATDAAAEWDEVAEHPPVAAGFDLDRLVLVPVESQHHYVIVMPGEVGGHWSCADVSTVDVDGCARWLAGDAHGLGLAGAGYNCGASGGDHQ